MSSKQDPNNSDHSQLIERIKALIAKAESSTFAAEADAFMAKAQGLIDAYAIEESNLKDFDVGEVGHENLVLKGSYSAERSTIWAVVAEANRCRILNLRLYRSSKVSEVILVGHPQDREVVKLMAFSLETQALTRMKSLEISAGISPVVTRRSFLRGFVMEIQRRLQAQQRLRDSLDGPQGGSVSRALVQVGENVDRYVQDQFDVSVGRTRRALSDGEAYSTGRLAGANADVGSNRIGDNRRALPPG